MTAIIRRNKVLYTQLRQLHKSTDGSSVPSFNMTTERKAFLNVLPEVINSVVTGPKLRDVPEVRSWIHKVGFHLTWTLREVEKKKMDALEMWCWRKMFGISWTEFRTNESILRELDIKQCLSSLVQSRILTCFGHVLVCRRGQLLKYMLGGGKLGRGLIISIGYKMFEDPENFSEETQHSARVLGWCSEMMQANFLIMDDIADSATIRRGKPCWHLQPNVGFSGINDALILYQSMLEVLDLYFGKSPIYPDLIRHFNESLYRATIGEHLDLRSNYNKDKNNLDIFNMDLINAIAINKSGYYSFKLPIFVPLLLVKNGKQKATEELSNICSEFGKLMQCQDDYMDAYGTETITGKTGRDIQEGKCTWVAVTALQHCNVAQRAIFKEYYGSKDPEHVKRIKQLYDELDLPQLYEQCERKMYDDLTRQIQALPNERDKVFLLQILNTIYKRLN